MNDLMPTPCAWLVCQAGCDERYPMDEVRYRCARCGGLLDVEHDLGALGQRSGAAWRDLFDRRARLAPPPYASGVWGKKEWVCPNIEDKHVVTLLEGWTPLLPTPDLGEALGLPNLLVKQCGHSHTGSFKDLGMTVLVSMVRHLSGCGHAVRAVACASTGDTSAALAAYAARAQIPACVFLPAGRISDEQLTQALANFAVTVALDTDFDGCMAVAAAFCERHGVYLANSMNPLRIEGQKTLSVEVCQQLGWEVPDWVVVPGGNLGNVTAIGRGFLLLRALGLVDRTPRLAVAQAEGAAPLWRAFRDGWRYAPIVAKPTLATAIQIGAPVNAHKAIEVLRALDGVVEVATEEELLRAAVLGDRHGLYTDPHTGVALAAAAKLAAAGTIGRDERVVVVSTAHGLKFSAFKRSYHLAGSGPAPGVAPAGRNAPLFLPADLPSVERALLPLLDTRWPDHSAR
ncbi:MAG: threonine synthase [Myxococcales bacterium]|nr:threonine synthase [Myxococcota bacterium]MDW8283441.1 threonine synthase [Myxococcales bacterium]